MRTERREWQELGNQREQIMVDNKTDGSHLEEYCRVLYEAE